MKIEHLNENTNELLEWGNNPASKLKALEKEEKKRKKNEFKVLAIDFLKDNKDAVFYLPDIDNGKGYIKKGLSQDDWVRKFKSIVQDYDDDETKAKTEFKQWHDAIVTTSTGLLIRRAAEDMRGKVEQLVWGSNDRGDKKYYENTAFSKNPDPALDAARTELASDSSSSETPTTGDAPKDTTDTTSTKPKKTRTPFDPSILSKNSVGMLINLMNNNNLKVLKSDGSEATTKDIMSHAENPQELVNYKIDVRGKKVGFPTWFRSARAAGLMEKYLTEEPVKIQYDYDDIMDPAVAPSIKGIMQRNMEADRLAKEQAAKEARRQQLRAKHADVIREMDELIDKEEQPSKILEVLFEDLVPSEGAAETVAGELVRAMMRVLYRDYNDGDKFYEAYGIETCGSSIAYLYDTIPSVTQFVDKMYDRVHIYEADDDKYTDDLEQMATLVMNYIRENPETLDDINEVDSREYDNDWVKDQEPRYETEIGVSDDLYTLIDNGIVNSWKLKDYVEDAMSWENIYEGAEVDRPFGHYDTSVSISNLTKDALNQIEETWAKHLDSFWQELVDEYTDELNEINSDDDYEEEESEDEDTFEESFDLEESFVFTSGDEAIEGMMGNMDDAELDKNIRALTKAARLLNLKRPEELVIFMDEDGAYSPTQFDGVAVGEKIQPHVVKNINLVSEMIGGNLYLYFSNESNAKRYLNFIKTINQYE